MKTTHLDNEINRLKWLKRKGDLSPIGENTLIEYEAIKQALSIANVVRQSESLCEVCNNDGVFETSDGFTTNCPRCN